MTIEVSSSELYSDGDICELNYTDISFVLEGSPGYISGAKILIEYDAEMGLFIGSGHSNEIVTGEDGTAIGGFKVHQGVVGSVPLTAKLDRFHSVNQTIDFQVYTLPVISGFYADCNVLSPDDSTHVHVVLSDDAGRISGKEIIFSTNLGYFRFGSVSTDENGIAGNVFFADNQTGYALLSASLEICPHITEHITIDLD